MRAVSPHAGCAEVISADFTCSGDQPGCCCSSSAAAPETCGAAMLVPSKTANGAPANSGSVEERICPPGAATSGFSLWSKLVGPPEEKLVMIPLRPVWISFGSLTALERKVVRPPWPAMYARRLRAVEVGDHPGREAEVDGDEVRLAEAVVDEQDPGRAGLAHALHLRDERAAAARDERDRPAQRAGRQRSEARVVRVEPGRRADVALDRLAVRAGDRADVGERLPGDPGRRRRGR